MTKLEKVIKGLRCIKGDTILCRECDYADVDGYGNYSCKINCAIDAIELLKEQADLGTELTNALDEVELIHKKNERIKKLLKEQEAIVHPEPSCEMTYVTDCCCDLCGVQLIREDNFCRCCGKRIEWESR